MGRNWISWCEIEERKSSKDAVIVGGVEKIVGVPKFARLRLQSCIFPRCFQQPGSRNR